MVDVRVPKLDGQDRVPEDHLPAHLAAATLDQARWDDLVAALVAGSRVTLAVDHGTNRITVSTSATTNADDAYLLDRGNHTGQEGITDVAGLQDALNSKHAEVANTKVPHIFVYSDEADARPTADANVVIWWIAANGALGQPTNATGQDLVDLVP